MKIILLDTNAYSKLLTGADEVLDIIATSDTVYMSIFVLGELYAGFKGGTKEKYNIEILNTFLHKPGVKILNATDETAQYFALVKNQLKKAGKPIPVNDIWIAAHAVESGSILVSYDHHFNVIDNLRLWDI
ncbi:type II toxin-antitoxin system VapC family toxin [Desulfobacterales bacterium HSG17]|nr:type II toxin-antitoxin system VapC family toxin [Desulfobacterales bacterium HSG17]